MPGDYNKLTKPDLEAQLKERGLPHSGKKAELVARLQEDDAKKQNDAPETAAVAEDEIDWDDDAPNKDGPKAAETIPAETAEPQTEITEKTPVALEPEAVNGSPTTQEATSKPSEGDQATEEKPQRDYSLGLAQVTISDELEKLKARAKKFGLTEDQAAQDNIAKLERAQKFGEAEDLSGLNGALPERQRKRRGDHGDDGRVNKFRGRGGRFNNGRNRGPRREGGQRQDSGASGAPNWMSHKDREAAEARRKRFGG